MRFSIGLLSEANSRREFDIDALMFYITHWVVSQLHPNQTNKNEKGHTMSTSKTTNYRKAKKGCVVNTETRRYKDGSSLTIRSNPGAFGRKIISTTKRTK